MTVLDEGLPCRVIAPHRKSKKELNLYRYLKEIFRCFSGQFKFLQVVFMLLLSGCGSGDSDSQTSPTSNNVPVPFQASLSTTLNESVVFTNTGEVSSRASSVEEGKVTITLMTPEFQANDGDIFHLPPGANDRFPLGIAGRIESQSLDSNGGVELELSTVEYSDVVSRSIADVEFSLGQAEVVGIIAPLAVQAREGAQDRAGENVGYSFRDGAFSITSDPESSRDRVYKSFDVSGERINLDVTVDLDKLLDVDARSDFRPDISAGSMLEITGSVSNINLKTAHDFDVNDSDGIEFETSLEADVSTEVKFVGEGTFKGGYFSQAWKEVQDEAFDKFGIDAKLTGLDYSDKIGQFPLGGIVLSAVCPPNTCFVSPAATQTPLRQAKALGVILWLYVTMSGELSIEGELTPVGIAARRTVGFSYVDGDPDFYQTVEPIDSERNMVEVLKLNGELTAEARSGFTLDADFFFSGVRVASVGAFAGARHKLRVVGEGGYGIKDVGSELAHFGDACRDVSGQLGLGAYGYANVKFGYEIDTTWVDQTGGYSYGIQWPSEEQMSNQGWNGTWYADTLSWPDWLTSLCNRTSSAFRVSQPANTANSLAMSFDANGPEQATYTWNWGDGSAEEVSNTTSVTHTFPAAGSYSVSLSINTPYGQITDLQQTVYTGEPTADPERRNLEIYVSEKTGDWEVYSIDIQSEGTEKNLTRNSADDVLPVPSALFDKVAFTSDRTGNPEVFVMNIDGSGVVQITQRAGADALSAWSPDGTKLLILSEQGNETDLNEYDFRTGMQTQLTDYPGSEANASYSPDGSMILLMVEDSSNREIWLLSSDGSFLQAVSPDPSNDVMPAWSPDGAAIAFLSDRGGQGYRLYLYDMAFGTTSLLSGAGVDESIGWFSWAPDGGKLVFDSDISGTTQLYLVDANANERTQLTNLSEGASFGSWDLTGSSVVFSCEADGETEICVTDPNPSTPTSTVTNVTTGGGSTPRNYSTVYESGGGCFIASAAYGSYMHESVFALREFRDDVLLTNPFGTRVVKLYYQHSPPIAAFIEQHSIARLVVRVILTPIVYSVTHTAFFFLVLLFLVVCLGIKNYAPAGPSAIRSFTS